MSVRHTDFTLAYDRDPELPNLLLDPSFREELAARQAVAELLRTRYDVTAMLGWAFGSHLLALRRRGAPASSAAPRCAAAGPTWWYSSSCRTRVGCGWLAIFWAIGCSRWRSARRYGYDT